MDEYLRSLDFYEVEKADYRAYQYRLKDRKTYERSYPEQELTVVFDEETNVPVLGLKEESIMGTNAHRFFIFEFLDEDKLGDHLVTKNIILSQEQWERFLQQYADINKSREA